MRTATCCAMLLLLLIAGSASAATLTSSSHHYTATVPYGWEQVTPSQGTDFDLRPVGSKTEFPKISIMHESVNGQVDPYQAERNIRTGLATKQPGQTTTIVVDGSNYNPLTQLITVDYHTVEGGQTTKRCTMVCKVGDGMMIGCNLVSYALTYDLHKSALNNLVISLRLDAGYEFRGTTGGQSTPAVKPEPQRPSEPSTEQQPEPAAPSHPISLLPYIIGGAFCSFVGVVALMLGIVGIIVMSSRRRKPMLAV